MDEQQERADFEAWLATSPLDFIGAWEGWKARAALAAQGVPAGPVAWRTFDGEWGFDYRSYEGNEDYAVKWEKRNPKHAGVGWVEPLFLKPTAPELLHRLTVHGATHHTGDDERVTCTPEQAALAILDVTGLDVEWATPAQPQQAESPLSPFESWWLGCGIVGSLKPECAEAFAAGAAAIAPAQEALPDL